ncbi:MAG: thioredoxin domain-containing protein [Hyphomonadaceae bacterium]
MIRNIGIATSLSALMLTTACAQEVEVNTADRTAIEGVVRAYILENPEIIEDALIALAEKRDAEEEANAKLAIAENTDAIFSDARDYSIGPEDAAVTIVEFFDYHCGYCKASADWASALPAQYDGQVRVVFKEFPILKPESRDAALAALAAGEQGKYVELHLALMAARGTLKATDIDRIAERVGVDVEEMRIAMKTTANQQQISDVRALARLTGTTATPTFIIDGELVAGFDKDRLEQLIKDGIEAAG